MARVFRNPELRERGYGSRLMRQLAETLRTYQTGTTDAVGSVLYSDIGKNHYADLGWHPFPINTHITLDPCAFPEGPKATKLFLEDLERLCEEDEAMIRAELTSAWPNGKTRLMLARDLDHMLWHHS